MTSLATWLDRGPFALALSAGYFGFFAHGGFLEALLASGRTPIAASGSSAGAIIATAWAAGLTPDEIRRLCASVERRDLFDPRPGLGLVAGRRLRRVLEAALPIDDLTETRRPVALSVFEVRARKTRVVRSGPAAAAVAASCAVPGLFHPARIDGRLVVDGGWADPSGRAGAPDGRLLVHELGRRGTGCEISGDVATLRLGRLPRCGFFRLAAGATAWSEARERAAAWL